VRASNVKLWLARAQDATGINGLLLGLQRRVFRPHARAINYHAAHPEHLANFEAQVDWYARNYVSLGMKDLLDLQRGVWPHSRPGLILSFDDGLREAFDHAVPILDRHGFRAWFFVPTKFVDTPPAEQRAFAARHDITAPAPASDPRIALTWDEIRELDRRGHVIGSHTCTHHRMVSTTPVESVRSEIFDSKRILERQLGHEVPIFCWVGGEEETYSAEAAGAIRDAGYRIAFQTHSSVIRPGANLHQIQRTNIEAWDPLSLVRFQLSGFMDAFSSGRRRRVERLTA
jgi:peptidoglycan/xylan/chitin deacetylase (PgdA/CDA1 family)